MSDQQKVFLKEDHVRHVLVLKQQDARTAAKWNNEMQAYTEALPWGIPINFSSDPRHGAGGDVYKRQMVTLFVSERYEENQINCK